MNFGSLLRAFDTVAAVRDAARRLKTAGPSQPSQPEAALTPANSLHGPIEARLTGVVIAALREAFDRDRARLDLERAQLDEQRRRADEALRAELRRQAVDREVGRLRLIAGTALVGWIAAVAFALTRLGGMSPVSRAVSAAGWLSLLAAIAVAFIVQGRIGAAATGSSSSVGDSRSGDAALGLLIVGLACAGIALLL